MLNNQKLADLERQSAYLAIKLDCLILDLINFQTPLSQTEHQRIGRLSRIADKAHERAERRFMKAYF